MKETKISFIGPGKVAVNLARYFTYNNLNVCGFYGHNCENALKNLTLNNIKIYENISELVHENNIIFITTPDDIISKIDKKISNFDLKDKFVCHCSGSLNSDVLYNAKHAGAKVYSIHPMFAFSSKNIPIKDLKEIWFSLEGDNHSLKDENSIVVHLMKKIHNNYFFRNSKNSIEYHVANVMVSNLILSLINMGIKYMMKCGLDKQQSLNALKPLIMHNIESAINKGVENSLTGPVVRNDINTVKRHKKVLEKEDKILYDQLSLNLLNIMFEKNNTHYNEYAEIISVLKE